MAGSLLVQRDVGGELLLLSGDVGRIVISLGLLDLESSGLEEQLEDLVLDFAVLEAGSGSTGSGIHGVVESIGLSTFGSLSSSLQDCEIRSRNTGKVGQVNL